HFPSFFLRNPRAFHRLSKISTSLLTTPTVSTPRFNVFRNALDSRRLAMTQPWQRDCLFPAEVICESTVESDHRRRGLRWPSRGSGVEVQFGGRHSDRPEESSFVPAAPVSGGDRITFPWRDRGATAQRLKPA